MCADVLAGRPQIPPASLEVWCTVGRLPETAERRCGICHAARDVEPEWIGTCSLAFTCPQHRLRTEDEP